MTTSLVEPATDPRWDAYVEGHPRGIVYQHSSWLRCLRHEYPKAEQLGVVVTGADGGIAGVLALQWTKGMPIGPKSVVGRRLASLPRTGVSGPLADDDEAHRLLLGEAIRLAQGESAQLQVKLSDPIGTEGFPGAALHPWRESYVIDLPGTEEEIRFGNSRNHARIRWAVNKARKAGVTVRPAVSEADIRAWYPLYLEALRIHAVPPRSLRLFLGLWKELAPHGRMTLLLAEDAAGALLAGSVVLELGETAFYAFNGIRRSALTYRPNEVLQWEAIHAAVRAGRTRYDLGEVVERHVGLADFKRKWGASPQRLQRLYHPAPSAPPDPGDAPGRVRHGVEAAWSRLPLRATSALGDLAYRYL